MVRLAGNLRVHPDGVVLGVYSCVYERVVPLPVPRSAVGEDVKPSSAVETKAFVDGSITGTPGPGRGA